jgi:TRAP-type C4-dicarboxylate transport system permease small subunit
MNKGLRLTEKWMQRALWLLALVFAGFLIGLGGKIVDNMWRVEPPAPAESFIDPVKGPATRAAAAQAEANRKAASERLE